jgi:simple sugar transport system permease protein
VKRYIPLLATIAVFVLITGAAALRYPGFLSVGMLVNLLRDNAVLGVVGVGMTSVVACMSDWRG